METQKEDKLLKEILEDAKRNGRLTGEHVSKLHFLFRKRFLKAWKAVKEEQVKKYVFKPSGRVVWIVVGKERDYLILPAAEFCTCDDFYFRVMDREVHLCYHLIAQKIAEALNWFDQIEESDELYETLMREWRKATA
jgi:predicted nucleic acid-binding Zn finger protein